MPLPSGWLNQDVGAPPVAGSTTWDGTSFSVSGSGRGPNGAGDIFQFAYKAVAAADDCVFTARLASVDYNGHSLVQYANFGIAIRDSLSTTAAGVVLQSNNFGSGTTPSQIYWRAADGGSSSANINSLIASGAIWLRITKTDLKFTAQISADGVTWTNYATGAGMSYPLSLSFPGSGFFYVGLVVNWAQSVLATGVFDNVTVAATAPAPIPGADPQIILRCSNDGGETWGGERITSMGKLGEYSKLVAWRQLGRSNNRVFEVICSEPVLFAVIAADLDVS
jgi:hypothetical protein